MKIHKNPKLLEYDETERIVDIFVKKDSHCPYPFTNGEWWHQGFYLQNFILYLNLFFEENKLPYKVKKTDTKSES
jgi:hypothetical protein